MEKQSLLTSVGNLSYGENQSPPNPHLIRPARPQESATLQNLNVRNYS